MNTYVESKGEFWACVIMLGIVAAVTLEVIIYF